MSDQLTTRQGQIWRVTTIGGRLVTVVILDSDLIAAHASMIAGYSVRPRAELPESAGMLAVEISDTDAVCCGDLQVYRRDRFAELLGQVSADQLDVIKNVTRIRFDL